MRLQTRNNLGGNHPAGQVPPNQLGEPTASNSTTASNGTRPPGVDGDSGLFGAGKRINLQKSDAILTADETKAYSKCKFDDNDKYELALQISNISIQHPNVKDYIENGKSEELNNLLSKPITRKVGNEAMVEGKILLNDKQCEAIKKIIFLIGMEAKSTNKGSHNEYTAKLQFISTHVNNKDSNFNPTENADLWPTIRRAIGISEEHKDKYNDKAIFKTKYEVDKRLHVLGYLDENNKELSTTNKRVKQKEFNEKFIDQLKRLEKTLGAEQLKCAEQIKLYIKNLNFIGLNNLLENNSALPEDLQLTIRDIILLIGKSVQHQHDDRRTFFGKAARNLPYTQQLGQLNNALEKLDGNSNNKPKILRIDGLDIDKSFFYNSDVGAETDNCTPKLPPEELWPAAVKLYNAEKVIAGHSKTIEETNNNNIVVKLKKDKLELQEQSKQANLKLIELTEEQENLTDDLKQTNAAQKYSISAHTALHQKILHDVEAYQSNTYLDNAPKILNEISEKRKIIIEITESNIKNKTSHTTLLNQFNTLNAEINKITSFDLNIVDYGMLNDYEVDFLHSLYLDIQVKAANLSIGDNVSINDEKISKLIDVYKLANSFLEKIRDYQVIYKKVGGDKGWDHRLGTNILGLGGESIRSKFARGDITAGALAEINADNQLKLNDVIQVIEKRQDLHSLISSATNKNPSYDVKGEKLNEVLFKDRYRGILGCAGNIQLTYGTIISKLVEEEFSGNQTIKGKEQEVQQLENSLNNQKTNISDKKYQVEGLLSSLDGTGTSTQVTDLPEEINGDIEIYKEQVATFNTQVQKITEIEKRLEALKTDLEDAQKINNESESNLQLNTNTLLQSQETNISKAKEIFAEFASQYDKIESIKGHIKTEANSKKTVNLEQAVESFIEVLKNCLTQYKDQDPYKNDTELQAKIAALKIQYGDLLTVQENNS